MSFFEPLPPPPDAQYQWSPPLWDRPSEGVVPAIVPVGALLHRGDDVAVALQYLGVYPNGFTINILIASDPHQQRVGRSIGMLSVGGSDPMQRFPRVGVRFADGSVGGQGTQFGARELAKDEHGVPTEPFVGMSGGGGGSHSFQFGVWVFPLPPDGPLDIFVSLPAAGVDEAHVTVDGALVRAHAEHAHVLWS